MLDTRKLVSTNNAPAPAGHYSQAIVHAGVAYISGQTARRVDGSRAKDEPFAVQAQLALNNLAAVAKAAGTSLENALQVTVYLVDPGNAAIFDAEYAKFVTQPLPSRAIVQSSLTVSDIEISAIVAVE